MQVQQHHKGGLAGVDLSWCHFQEECHHTAPDTIWWSSTWTRPNHLILLPTIVMLPLSSKITKWFAKNGPKFAKWKRSKGGLSHLKQNYRRWWWVGNKITSLHHLQISRDPSFFGKHCTRWDTPQGYLRTGLPLFWDTDIQVVQELSSLIYSISK